MVVRVGDGLPSTLTAERIKAVLGLEKNHERILKEALDAKASPVWRATDQDADLYERLCALVATVDGRDAYEQARRDFEDREPNWLGKADLYRCLLQDCQKTTTSNFSICAIHGYDFDADLILRLAAEGAWTCLAEVVWVESLIFEDADQLINASTTYPDILTHLESVQAGLIRENDNIRPILEEEEEANQLIQRMNLLANALEADNLKARELQVLSLYLRRLTELARMRTHQDHRRSLLKTQIERWEESHAEQIGKTEAVVHSLATLKTLVERSTAGQNTVTAFIGLAGKQLSLETRCRETRARMTQASVDADFGAAHSLLDTLESLSVELNEASLAIGALLNEPLSHSLNTPVLDEQGTAKVADTPPMIAETHATGTPIQTLQPEPVTQILKEEVEESNTDLAVSTDDRFIAPQARHADSDAVQPSEDLAQATEVLEVDENGNNQDATETIWAAINNHRFAIAYHLALPLPDASPSASTIAFVAYNYVTDQRVSLRTELSDLAGTLLNRVKIANDDITSGPLWRDEAVLIACAALVPALEVPGGMVAQLLSSLEPHLGEFPSLRTLVRVASQVSMKGVDLPTSSLREDDTVDKWREREAALRIQTTSWLTHEYRSTIKYHAATRVWRRMLENWNGSGRSSLGHLFALLDKPAEEIVAEQVADLTEYWRANREKEIDRIDRENRRRASTKKIEGSARLDLRHKIDQALNFSDRWLSLIKKRPDNRPAFPTEQAKLLRSAVSDHGDQVLAEVTDASIALGRSSAPLLKRYMRLFNAERTEDNQQTISLTDLLNAELLADPDIEFDSTGTVVTSSLSSTALQALLSQNNPDYAAPAISRAQRGDFRGAEMAIDFAERTGRIDDPRADLCREKVEQQRSRAQESLQHKIRETSDRLDAAYAAGALTLETFERLRGEIPVSNIAEAEAFTGLFESLEQVEKEILGAQAGRRDALSRSLKSLRRLSTEDRDRVELAISNGLFQIAEDFIERIERGEQLPDSDAVTEHPFDQFFPTFVDSYTALAVNSDGAFEQVHKLIQTGGSADLIDAADLSDDARRDAIDVLNAWAALRDNRTSIRSLTALMMAIGFGDAKIKGSNDNTHGGETVFQLQTAPITDRNIAKLPDFGSRANGRYRVFAIRDRITEEAIIREVIQQTAPRIQPSIVVFLGTLDADARRTLADAFRSGNYHPTIVLDEAMVAFLAMQLRNRLGALFDCASAFAFAQPFDPDAADVPPEMFFGRTDARKAIVAMSGDTTHFLYGGRRLGKTALLSSIAREYHTARRAEPKQLVLLLNLKGSGIGENRPTEDLWTLFAEHLSEHEVLQPKTVRPESIEKGVREWLDGHEGRRILLLVDEADAFLDAERSPKQGYRVLEQIKRLMEQTQRRFKVVFAGLHNVQRAARDPNTPFAHLGDAIRIGPMLPETDQDGIQNLIRHPLEALGYRFTSNDSVIRIAAETNYYPALAQQFCKELLKTLREEAISYNASGPPYAILPETVDRVFNARETRDRIRNLFSWTIQLDTRYEFLTYLIAQKSFDNDDARPQAVSITDIRDAALSEWREGFTSDSSYWMFEVLLEEMVGLGILRETSEKHYAIRTRNLRMLLGNDEELERRFVDAKSKRPPPIFDSAQFRATLSDETPSSLTADQERRLLSGRRVVGLVFGTRLAGLDRIADSLKQAGKGRERELHIVEVPPASIRNALNRVSRTRKPGIHVVLVDMRGDWDPNIIDRAIAFVGDHDSQKRLIRPIFLCGPEETWNWIASSAPSHDRVERRDVWLGPCALEFTRNWLASHDSLAYSSMENTDHAFDHPWPPIAAMAAQQKNLQSITDAANAVWKQDGEFVQVSDVLISDGTKTTLRLLCTFSPDSITADFLSELSSEEGTSMSPEEVDKIFDWADRLGIVHRDEFGYRLDSTYAEGLGRKFEG